MNKLDYKALQNCDSVTLRMTAGVTQIECIKEIKDDPFEKEKRYVIPVESKVQDYANGVFHARVSDVTSYAAHYWRSALDYVEEWQTFLYVLKPSDTVSVKWVFACNTEAMDDAGWNCDEVSLVIHRTTKTKTINLEFKLDSRFVNNRTSRMLQAS